MGSRMIRDRSTDGSWWLMVGLFSLCVVGWSMAFSFKVGAADIDRSDADRSWSVTDFSRISISGSPEVELVEGNVEAVSGNGDDDALDQLEVFVDDGELIVRNKRSSWLGGWKDNDVELVIAFKSIDQLKVSGAAELRAEQVTSDNLRLAVSGSGDIEIESLDGETLNLTVSGSADVDVAGSVQDQAVRISGSADYQAEELTSETAQIRISGSGDARVSVSATLDATISGSGSVRYVGDPEVRSRVSGSGDIKQL